jgi:hypothetical protein
MAIASQGNPRRMNDLDLRRELIDRRWVTPSEAAFLIGKSKRMLNRWCTPHTNPLMTHPLIASC